MRRKRRNNSYTFNRYWLFGTVIFLVLILGTTNAVPGNNHVSQMTTLSAPGGGTSEVAGFAIEVPKTEPQEETDLQPDRSAFLTAELWADISEEISTPKAAHTTTDRISLNVKDANLLDVLSMLAYKLDANVIFLEEPSQITIKTESLSPITTFQTVLQKEGLDYLVLGRNYIVGERGRLYADFTNRMFLTRCNLFYVSADNMKEYIEELGMPLHSLAVEENQRAIWLQGTPMALGKARELINTLDVMENAAFAVGGSRKVRMPVAVAVGSRAQEELEALIDMLSILLDGFRDGRTEFGWVTWDHPDPVPRIIMDWKSPIIRPYDILMKITRDFANDHENQIRYLIAEGNPDNIEIVNQMIDAIGSTQLTPISLTQILEPEPEPDDNNNSESNSINSNINQQSSFNTSPQGGSVQSYSVSLNGVPSEGGRLSGAGSYSEGSSVTVNAVPADGYKFVRWIENGAQMSTSLTYTFNLYRNVSLEAVFIKDNSNNSAVEDIEDRKSDED